MAVQNPNQLGQIINDRIDYYFGNEDEKTSVKSTDPHPLLETTASCGVTIIRRGTKQTKLDIFHKKSRDPVLITSQLSSIAITRTTFVFSETGKVEMRIEQKGGLAPEIKEKIDYARSAYLPKKIREDLPEHAGKIAHFQLDFEELPELIDFIDCTASFR